MQPTQDLHICDMLPLMSPRALKTELPMTEAATGTVVEGRQAIQRILRRAVDGHRLTPEEGVALFACRDLPALGRAADAVCRRLHLEPYRTYNIDRNINYTNVCAAVCDFCAFYRKTADADAYVLPREELYRKIEETIALGGDQILMQGGNHPSLAGYTHLVRAPFIHFDGLPRQNFRGYELLNYSLLGLVDIANERTRNLGYGKQRLIEIALALAAKPRVLLLNRRRPVDQPPVVWRNPDRGTDNLGSTDWMARDG